MNSILRARLRFCVSFFLILTVVDVTTRAATLQQPAIYFTENRGQWDERVLYKADGGVGLTWWFERDGLTLAVVVPDTVSTSWRADTPVRPDLPEHFNAGGEECPPSETQSSPRKGHALKLRFVPSLSQSRDVLAFATDKNVYPPQNIEVIPDGKLSWNNNYFLGNDSSKWAPDYGNFTRLTYRNVWDGIDVVYYGEGNQLKYDYVVKPGADPSNVRLRWLGLEEPLELEQGVFARNEVTKQSSATPSTLPLGVRTQRTGTDELQGEDTLKQSELLLATSVGTLREGIPLAYQRSEDGARLPVAVSMRVLSVNEFGLEVTGDWDRSKELVVDPLVWSTFLGSSDRGDEAECIADIGTTSDSCAVVCLYTYAENFPVTEGAFDIEYGGLFDIIIAKISRDGSGLSYSTYLGGSDQDLPTSICADSDEGVIVVGYTGSVDYPITEGVLQVNHNGEEGRFDAFASRLTDQGNGLIFSTYLGGTGSDQANSVVINEEGEALIAGLTSSEDFPVTEDAFQVEPAGSEDAFVLLLSEDGEELEFCTFLGGAASDEISACLFEEEMDLLGVGTTQSDNLPTSEGALQPERAGRTDGFLSRLSNDGSQLLYGTYFGGARTDNIRTLSIAENGVIFIGGSTESNDFPVTEGAHQTQFIRGRGGDGTYHGFVAKIIPGDAGEEISFASYIGGPTYDNVQDLLPDGKGGVIICGESFGMGMPTTQNAFQPRNPSDNSFDGFVARLDSSGAVLVYSTFIGGRHDEGINGICLDREGGVLFAGYTCSTDYPVTEGAFQPEYGGRWADGFITRLDLGLLILWWVEVPDTIWVDESSDVQFQVIGGSADENAELRIAYASDNLPEPAVFEDNGDGTGSFLWQTTFDDAGEYSATFTLSDGENEISADVVIIVNNVNRAPVWAQLPNEGTYHADEGSEADFVVVAADPDSDSITLSARSRNLPEGWVFNDRGDGTGRFRWQTDFESGGQWDVAFTARDSSNFTETMIIIFVHEVESALLDQSAIPDHYFLADAFPNPFNSTTTIRFGLPVAGEVSLSVWDLSGKQVADLLTGFNPILPAGYHDVLWDAGDLPAGSYMLILKTADYSYQKKVILTK